MFDRAVNKLLTVGTPTVTAVYRFVRVKAVQAA